MSWFGQTVFMRSAGGVCTLRLIQATPSGALSGVELMRCACSAQSLPVTNTIMSTVVTSHCLAADGELHTTGDQVQETSFYH